MFGRGAGAGWRKRLADGEPHRSDLLLLRHDDFLRDPQELLIVAVAQLCLGHFDRALVMQHHPVDKILIDVAGWASIIMVFIIFVTAASI